MSERERAHEKKGNKPVGKWNKKRRPKKRRKLNHSLVSYTHTKLKSKRKPIFICTNSRFPCTLHTTLTYIDTHASKHTDQHIAYTHTQHSNWIQAHGSEKNNASFFISSLFSYDFFLLLFVILFVSVSFLLSFFESTKWKCILCVSQYQYTVCSINTKTQYISIYRRYDAMPWIFFSNVTFFFLSAAFTPFTYSTQVCPLAFVSSCVVCCAVLCWPYR